MKTLIINTTISILFSVFAYSQDENLTLVSPAGEDAVISYFHQFPDSPDGKKLVFTIFKEGDKSDIVVKDLQTEEFFTINTVNGINRHTGTYAIWIDDSTLAYDSNVDNIIYIHNIYTGEIDQYEGSQISDYSSTNNKILYKSKGKKRKEKHVYVLDLNTKTTTSLINIYDVEKLREEMGTETPIKEWNFDHPYWSPDGKKIMFQVKAKLRDENRKVLKSEAFLFYADANGKNIHCAGYKPMHVQWWDNESAFGFDTNKKTGHHMHRYDLNGKIIQENVIGHGNHGTVSPNQEWVVTDTWYKTDPIKVHLYGIGDIYPTKVLFAQPKVVNGKDFWDVHSHIHPAFSRDGKKVYFNGMAKDGLSKVWCYDLTEIVE